MPVLLIFVSFSVVRIVIPFLINKVPFAEDYL